MIDVPFDDCCSVNFYSDRVSGVAPGSFSLYGVACIGTSIACVVLR